MPVKLKSAGSFFEPTNFLSELPSRAMPVRQSPSVTARTLGLNYVKPKDPNQCNLLNH
jgi:hypothetical protein